MSVITPAGPPLRVALLAGTLAQAGAEKQFVYIAQALSQAGATVRVFCLTRREFYEPALAALGLTPHWVGRLPFPPLRLAHIIAATGSFRPDVIHAVHPYVNLYAAGAARVLGALALGSLRNSLPRSQQMYGAWTPWLVRAPDAIAANSRTAVAELRASGLIKPQRVYWLKNAIDLERFDQATAAPASGRGPGITAIFVGRHMPVKRVDLFLRALAQARAQVPALRGLVVGDGPERARAEQLADELGLRPDGVRLLGRRDDVPSLLAQADMFVLTSDAEGLPNVVLEAMAARLPVITTPAGDAGVLVQDGITGYSVAMGDAAGIATRMVALAQAPELRRGFGAAGRLRVERSYDLTLLSSRLFAVYRDAAEQSGHRRVLHALGDAGGDLDALREVRA